MVVDIGVVGIVLDRLLEALKCLFGITLFHVHTGNLYPRLRQRRLKLNRRQEVLLGAEYVRHQESKVEGILE